MDDKIIQFPGKNTKSEATPERFYAACPQCRSMAWELEVDKPEVEKILAFRCANPSCGYTIPLIMNVNFTESPADQIFKFEPENDSDIQFKLEDDADE